MASKSSLAPSRDALRALRSLALSPHAALVGAVGSCCALAAVQYHERRRVRLAEHLLERKRTLHTISQGRGSAQIARMFEAAERGEDFTIHHGRPRKSQRKRSVSNLAQGREERGVYHFEDGEIPPELEERSVPLQNLGGHKDAVNEFDRTSLADTFQHNGCSHDTEPLTDLSITSTNFSADHIGKKESEAIVNVEQSFKPFSHSLPQRSLLTREITASKRVPLTTLSAEDEYQNHLHDAIKHWRASQASESILTIERAEQNRSKSTDRARIGKWRSYRDRALRVSKRSQLKTQWMDNPKILTLGETALMERGPTDLSEQPLSDLSSPTTLSTNRAIDESADISAMPAEESIFFNFVYGKPNGTDKRSANTFQSMLPWEQDRFSFGEQLDSGAVATGSVSQNLISPHDDTIGGKQLPVHDLPIPYIRSSDQIPPHSRSRSLRLRYFKQDAEKSDLVEKVNPDRFRYVFHQIAHAWEEHGMQSAKSLLQDTAQKYAESGDPSDLLLAQNLLQEFRHHIPGPDIGVIRNEVVYNILNSNTPQKGVVLLLYPSLVNKDRRQRPVRYAEAGVQYMQHICDSNPNFKEQMDQLEKLLKATLHCGVCIDERLMLPVIRSMIRKGNISHAQSCYDQITKHFHIDVLDVCYREIVQGYAQAGNWWKVKMMFMFPPPGQSAAEKVQGFASMFSHTMDLFAAKNSVEKLCAYVMQAIEMVGLFPTAQITRKLAGHCVRSRRYDLIEQYLDMVRRDFSSLDLGTSSSPFALEMASAWREIGASCEDVYRTCLAFWTISVHDPYSKTLRSMASAIISRDIVLKMRGLEELGGLKIPDLDGQVDVETMAHHVRKLVKYHHDLGFTAETKPLGQDLVASTRVMIELDQLFSGTKRLAPGYRSAKTRRDDYSQVHDQNLRHVGGRLPASLQAYRLPASPVEIVSLLEKYYTANAERKLDIDHSALKFVASRLASLHRDHDCYEVLNAIHASKWVQAPTGKPFDLDLFLRWLDAATTVRSAPRMRNVLWAVVDSDADLHVTTEFLLKVRVAIPRTSLSKMTSIRQSAVAENEYLSYRIKRRIFEQQLRVKGRPSQIQFREWTCAQFKD